MELLAPSALAPEALARRLLDLVGDERAVQVEFLLHLDEFDRRRAWAEAAHPSLWDYLLRVLHLREGAAYRRIAAMKVLRRLPRLADALRDGRLCLSTIALLGPVLTEENADDLLGRAGFGTKAEVERIVAGIAPRAAPRDGVRKLPDRREPGRAAAVPLFVSPVAMREAPEAKGGAVGECAQVGPATSAPTPLPAGIAAPATLLAPATAARRPTIRPVAENAYALRVTLDGELKADLDELTALLGHKVPDGDLAAVLRVAVGCAIEKYGKRKGARTPARQRPNAEALDPEPAGRAPVRGAPVCGGPAPVAPLEGSYVRSEPFEGRAAARAAIPAAVRREVWRRDGGRCTFVGPDGRRCTATAHLEFDHIRPVALGGDSTVGNVRIACKPHNILHAERVFGREHMDRFRRGREPEAGSPGRSGCG